MTTEVAVMPTTLVAISGEGYEAAKGSLAGWLRGKLAQIRTEIDEVDRVEKEARSRDFNPSSYQRMRSRHLASLTWYEKLLAGIEAGYTLMPDLPLSLFAIRTNRKRPKRNQVEVKGQRWEGWSRVDRATLEGQPLPIGEGAYVSGRATREATDSRTEQEEGKTIGYLTFANTEHRAIALPVQLVKPELVEEIGKALDRKLFDEIGVCVPVRPGATGRGDPLVMGRIYRDSRRQKAVCFVIGWYVQVRDLL